MNQLKVLVLSLLCTLLVSSCRPPQSGDVAAICENALVKQAVVITAALARNVPVQQYVDGLCKIAAIAEPFYVDALKPTSKGDLGAVDPIDRALSAARERGLVE